MLHDEVKAAVLTAIRAGHSIRSIHQQELELPDRGTIKLWLNTDLVFAAAFAQAERDRGPSASFRKRQKRPRKSKGLTPQVRAQILTAVEAGDSLSRALAPKKGLPARSTVLNYALTDLEFARRLNAARARVGIRALQAKCQIANKEKQYLAKFPEFIRRIEDGQLVRKIFSEMRLGGRSFGAFLRRNPAKYQQLIELRVQRARRRFAPEHYEQALARFVLDVSTSVNNFKPERLPSYHAMHQRCAHHPEFAEAFAIARRERIAKRCQIVSIKRKSGARPVFQTAVLRGQLLQDELYRAAEAAVGRGLPEHTRDDVKADLIEAVLLDSFPIEEMAEHAAAFVTAHHRRMETYRSKSLDETLSDDNDMTFLDRLTTDDYSFAE
jgi:hypothetical protein